MRDERWDDANCTREFLAKTKAIPEWDRLCYAALVWSLLKATSLESRG